MKTVEERLELGRTIAQMYIKAQGVSLNASNAACDIIENEDIITKFAFNQTIKNSPYNVIAQLKD